MQTENVFTKLNLLDSDNVVNCVISYGKNQGKILSFSSKFAEFFKYEQTNFRYIANLEDLLPLTIKEIHSEFVDNFLKKGVCKFFKNVTLTYGKDSSDHIFPIEVAFDINFMIKNDFAFIVFLKKIAKDTTDKLYIMLNSDGQITGVSSNFHEKLLMDSSSIYNAKGNSSNLVNTLY